VRERGFPRLGSGEPDPPMVHTWRTHQPEELTPGGAAGKGLRKTGRGEEGTGGWILDEDQEHAGSEVAGEPLRGHGAAADVRQFGGEPDRSFVEHRSGGQHHHHRCAVVEAAELSLGPRDLPVGIAPHEAGSAEEV